MDVKVDFGITRDEPGYMYDGAYYETLHDVLSIGILGFCGCGIPDTALKFIIDCMTTEDPDYPTILDGQQIVNLVAAEPKIAAYIIMYLLTDKGLAEHGSYVPGWLTDEGIEFVRLYKENAI